MLLIMGCDVAVLLTMMKLLYGSDVKCFVFETAWKRVA
jgi:hypothetical protein